MKTIIRFLSIAAIVGCLFACGNADALRHQQANEKMQEIVNELNAIGLSVAVVKDGKLVYAEGFGYQSLEDSIPLSTCGIFRIASISKSFTATAIMQLHEQGKFDLDDDIGDALEMTIRNPNFPEIPITYRMLLTHTSSLNDSMGWFNFHTIDPILNENYWRAFNDYAPGTEYQYNNLGFNILGALVEAHSGKRFDIYVDNNIMKPLGMTGSFNVDALDASRFVTLYHFRDGKPVASQAYTSPAARLENYVLGRNAFIFSPTGGMKATPKDLAKHLLVQINGGTYNGVQILKPESVAAMQTPHRDDSNYGFGISTVTNLVEGVTLKGHTGSAYGLFSAMFFCPEEKFGIIMMTNGYPAERNENNFMTIQADIINALYDVFIGK